jgi:formiminotetrahydrofolate cyclodeaminase
MDKTLSEFQSELASSAPTPGGGTACAVALGQAAALTKMVIELTLGKEKWQSGWIHAEAANDKTEEILILAGKLAVQDSDAFDLVMDSFRMPKSSDDEKALRREKIRQATLHAAEVPYKTACLSLDLLKLLNNLATYGNANAASDVGVAGLLASAACKGALFNVDINLNSLPDEYGQSMRDSCPEILQECSVSAREIMQSVKKRIAE